MIEKLLASQWVVDKQSENWFCETNHMYRIGSPKKHTFFIASVEGSGDESEAVAKLIAAIPDMVAALDSIQSIGSNGRDDLFKVKLEAVIETARSALRKAGLNEKGGE